MAIARLEVKVGKKGKASPHASYIFREEKYAKPDDDLEKLEAKGHGNMPSWASANPNLFWKMSDEHERKNGSTYREHVIALPRELDENQRHELVKDWIAQELGDKHAYQYAIHNPIALDDKEQPHCHLMFSDRLVDDIERAPNQYFKRYNSKKPHLGGAKKANTAKLSKDRKEELKELRQRWEQTCNKHLQLANRHERISMKSYKDRGINWQPLNIPMPKFKQPKFKQAYIEQLKAKSEYVSARRERDELDIKAELSHYRTDELKQLTKHIFGSPPVSPQKSDLRKDAGRFTAKQLTTEEHTLAYKAMLYINSDNSTLEQERHYVSDTVKYDERQVREIIAYRQKHELNFKGSAVENYHKDFPERIKDFFHDSKNVNDDESKRIIKMITQPDIERREHAEHAQRAQNNTKATSVAATKENTLESQNTASRPMRPR